MVEERITRTIVTRFTKIYLRAVFRQLSCALDPELAASVTMSAVFHCTDTSLQLGLVIR